MEKKNYGQIVAEQMKDDTSFNEQLCPAQQVVMLDFIEGNLDGIVGDLADQVADLGKFCELKSRFIRAFIEDGIMDKLVGLMPDEQKDFSPDDMEFVEMVKEYLEKGYDAYSRLALLSEGELNRIGLTEKQALSKIGLSRSLVNRILKRAITIGQLLETDCDALVKFNND